MNLDVAMATLSHARHQGVKVFKVWVHGMETGQATLSGRHWGVAVVLEDTKAP